ncbi:STAS domain-containing protein [Listeria monocytogenes]|nr:STAS domain-containing protein [Listeria monocytogenes]
MGIMNSLLKQKEMVVKDWLTYYVSVDDPYIFTLKNDHRLMDETGFVLENLFIGMTEDLGRMNTFARELGKAQFITSLGISRILFHIRLLEEFLLDYASEIKTKSANYRELYLFSIKLHQVFSSFTQNLIEGYTHANEQMIVQKENQIIKESTKLIWIAENVFLLPLIGKITDERAKQITETALFEVCEQPVNYLIIDLSGVQLEPPNIGKYIEYFFSSLKLVGVTPIITGMQPQTAKVMVQANLTEQHGIKTFATLRQATKTLMKEKEARNAHK